MRTPRFYVVRIWQCLFLFPSTRIRADALTLAVSHKSRTRWVAVPIVLLMLVEAGAGVYSINAIASAGSWLLALRRAYTPGLVWISAAFVIDVTITSAMCYLLRRGRTEYARCACVAPCTRAVLIRRRTNTVLEKLVRHADRVRGTTGTLTSDWRRHCLSSAPTY
jgi:hypothetical protein